MTARTETMRTIQLDYDQIWVFDGGRDARVRVLHGATWLTEEGRAEDAFLCAGDEWRPRAGRTIVAALAPSRLQVVQATGRRGVGDPLLRLRRAWDALRQAIGRMQVGPAVAGR